MRPAEYPPQVVARFWSHVDIRVDGCWLWKKACNPYGCFHVAPGVTQALAHRVAYQLLVGPIPSGLQLDHLCRNPECCRPDHLEPVTIRENIRRSPIAPSSKNRAKTECVSGHPFSGSNTYVDKRGSRHCRTCSVARNRARRLKAKAGL